VTTIEFLKTQKRWVVWKLETKPGAKKASKVPYQIDGKRKARNNDPSTFYTFAECEAVIAGFDGIGMELGLVDGVYIVGVDIDNCCDAFTGKFSAESREYVIGLDSYTEYSPSGTGSHTWVVATLTDDKPIVKKVPGCKQIEIKGTGFYHTYTGRHISKTPAEVMDRQEQLDALCKRVLSISQSGVRVAVPQDEEAKFQKLWNGDTSDYDGDASRADLAFFGILMRRHHNDLFKVKEAAFESKLYREKWERSDYLSATILKAYHKEAVFALDDDEPLLDDSPSEYLMEPKPGDDEGWFPFGEVSLVGGSSGAGKTYFTIVMLDKIRTGVEFLGRAAKPRDYRVLLHDRSAKAMRRTLNALHLPPEAEERIIRLSARQQARQPAEILHDCIEQNPGVKVWFIEGLDLWTGDMNKMDSVAPVLDSLQRVATRHNVCVIGSVGSPKQKGKDRYFGRDAFFGSAALARKADTMVSIEWTDPENTNSARSYSIMPRNGPSVRLYMEWRDHGLCIVDKPEPKVEAKDSRAFGLMKLNVFAKYKLGEQVVYSPDLGAERTFYRWREYAVGKGWIVQHAGAYFRSPEVAKPN
jgi:AAA domain